MRPTTLLMLPALVLGVSACAPVETLNALTVVNGLRVQTNVQYGEHARQTLDLYAPAQQGNTPVVVFIPGGSWTGGDKSDYKFVGESLARAGIVTAVINYRLAPEHRYPDFIRDAAKATAWMRAYATKYGGDPNVMFVMGHSAGAFNAMEVVMNERWLREANVPISSVQGVIGLAGPYDYDFRKFESRQAFPEGAVPENVLPSRHVRDNPPPALLVVAGRDDVVAPENATKMAAALRAAGGEVTLVRLPGANHYTLVGALSTRLSFLNPVRANVLDFIGQHAKQD